MLTSNQIRQSFIDFFVQNGHEFVPSSSVVPIDDPTLLFTNAGMNQFKDIFLGTKTPANNRAVNSQKCIRVSGKHNDLEEVGKDTYHHTFFEMLGNWSFGDYFKKDAITWAWQLFTEIWKIEPEKLWATVFGGDATDGVVPDTDAEKIWIENTAIQREKVLRFGKKDNFWEMGEVGPCGPCSEIHMDLGAERCDKKNTPGHKCMVNGSCGRFIELWNLVFIQYNRHETGNLTELPNKHVDTGAGFERIVAVLQNKNSNYDTDLFEPIMNHIGNLADKKYTAQLENETDNAFRVISDHVRTLVFSIADGALPSNESRGYVLRRILRRAIRFGLLLDMHEPFIYKLVPTVVENMGQTYPEIAERAEHIESVIQAEETAFGKTLERGIEIFEADIAELKQKKLDKLPGEKVFRLYDTYGFPADLTELMAQEQNVKVDIEQFDELMAQQRQRARASQKTVTYQADALAENLPETDDTAKHHKHSLTGRLLGYTKDENYITDGTVPADTEVGLILDRTCAYAEAGGQVGDFGTIKYGETTFNFGDTKHIGPAVVHFGTTNSDKLTVGDECKIQIDPAREDTKRNHTATHLLQWALRETLGTGVHQQGSLVCADYLRFDFTCLKALDRRQIQQVEKLVRDKIYNEEPVTFKIMDIEEARKIGAMALFSEKYGQDVRVLAIGTGDPDELEEAFSREFCGGTHVNNTANIWDFKIMREESVATGVRRITAMTGRTLKESLYQKDAQIESLCSILKTTAEQVNGKVEALLEENKKLKKQLKKNAVGDLKTAAEGLLNEAEKIGDAKIIAGELPDAPIEAIREQIDRLRKKEPVSVIVIATTTEDQKVLLFAAVTDDLVKKGVKAGDIVKQIAPIVGGRGGGRPQMAQAGGKNPEKIQQAINDAKILVAKMIKG